MLNLEHPDHLTDLHALKQIQRGGMQAIETAAMNAMWDAIEQGKGREEAEEVFFKHFNKSHEQRISIPGS
jgi:hypothetical protein